MMQRVLTVVLLAVSLWQTGARPSHDAAALNPGLGVDLLEIENRIAHAQGERVIQATAASAPGVRTSDIDIDKADASVIESLELPVEEEAQWITNVTVLPIYTLGVGAGPPVPPGFTTLPFELRADIGLASQLVLAYERSYAGKPVTDITVSPSPDGCGADGETEVPVTRLISDMEWATVQADASQQKLIAGGAKFSRSLCVHRRKGARPITHIEVAVSGPQVVGVTAPLPKPKTFQGTFRSVRVFSFGNGIAVDIMWRIRPKLYNRNLRRSLAFDRWGHAAAHFRVETLPSAAFNPAHIRRRTAGVVLFGGKSFKPVVGDTRYHNDVQVVANTYAVAPSEDEFDLPDPKWKTPKWGTSQQHYTWRVTDIIGTPPTPRDGHTMTQISVYNTSVDCEEPYKWYSAGPPHGMRTGTKCATHTVAAQNWYVVFGGYDSGNKRGTRKSAAAATSAGAAAGAGGGARYYNDLSLLHIDHSSDPDGVIHGRWETPKLIGEGMAPLARTGHSANYVSKGSTIVFFGGYNAQNFSRRPLDERGNVLLNDLAFLNVAPLQRVDSGASPLLQVQWESNIPIRGTAPEARTGHSSAVLRLPRAGSPSAYASENDRTYLAIYGGTGRDGLLSDLHLLRVETLSKTASCNPPVNCTETMCCTNTTRCAKTSEATLDGGATAIMQCVSRVECCTNHNITATAPGMCMRNVTACRDGVCCSSGQSGLYELDASKAECADVILPGRDTITREFGNSSATCIKPPAWSQPINRCCDAKEMSLDEYLAAVASGAPRQCCDCTANKCDHPSKAGVAPRPVTSSTEPGPPAGAVPPTPVAPVASINSSQYMIACCSDTGTCECKAAGAPGFDKPVTGTAEAAVAGPAAGSCSTSNSCALKYCSNARMLWFSQFWFANNSGLNPNMSFCPQPVHSIQYVEWLHFGDGMANSPLSRTYHVGLSMLNGVRQATNSMLVVGGVHRRFESLLWGDGKTAYGIEPIARVHRLYCVEQADGLTPEYIARARSLNGNHGDVAPPVKCKWDLLDLDVRSDLKTELELPAPTRVDPVYSAAPAAPKKEASNIASAPQDLWRLRRPDPEVRRILGLTDSQLARADAVSGEHRHRPWNSDRRSFTATLLMDHSLLVAGGVSSMWSDVCRLDDAERVLAVGWPGFDRSLQVPIPKAALATTIEEAEKVGYWAPERKRLP